MYFTLIFRIFSMTKYAYIWLLIQAQQVKALVMDFLVTVYIWLMVLVIIIMPPGHIMVFYTSKYTYVYLKVRFVFECIPIDVAYCYLLSMTKKANWIAPSMLL